MTRRLISAIHVSFVLFLSTTSSLAVSSSTTSEASSEELLQQMHAHPSQSHTETQTQTSSSSQYGVDCSWPIHSLEFNNKTQRCSYKYPDLLGDRTSLYSNFIQGCRNQYGERCDETEFSRIEQARMQPQSMVNYTSTGYHKMRAPKRLFQLIIQEHWERNKHRATAEEEEEEQEFVEKWAKGHTYVNYWEINTTYYGLSDAKAGGSHALCDEILYEAQQVLEEWTSMELRPTSLYGIRVYKEGSILVPHVDRMPLVSSAIINVAQDPDMQEDWPLEVYDRNGQAVNISMVPGDMVLYESGSLVHGRPFPLKGKYYANVFLHFEPTGRTLEDVYNEDMMYDTPNNPGNYQDSVLLPPYVLPNSPAAIWYAEHVPFGWEKPVWEEEEDDEVETDNTASSSSDDLGEYDSDEDEHYYDSDEDDDDDDEEEHYYRTEAEYYSSDDDDDEYSNGEDDEDNWDRAEISEQIGVKSLYQSDQPKQQSQSTEPSCLSPIASEDPTKAPFICSDGPSRHETLEFKWSR